MSDIRIGLVLGSGGARGLAHIVAIETLERLGIRPVQIAGASIGAIIGAAYASGMSGARLRAHFLAEFRNRSDVMGRLFQTRVGKFSDIWREGLTNPVLVDGERVLDTFFPEFFRDTFADLSIPLTIVAADIHRLERVDLTEGPLKPAIAASMAIPGLVRPVVHQGKVMIDGGAIDPLPVRAITEPVDLILAIDISRAAQREESAEIPGFIETLTRAFDLMQLSLVESQSYVPQAPYHRVKARVDQFPALDFFRPKKVLTASASISGEIERVIEAVRHVKRAAISGPV